MKQNKSLTGLFRKGRPTEDETAAEATGSARQAAERLKSVMEAERAADATMADRTGTKPTAQPNASKATGRSGKAADASTTTASEQRPVATTREDKMSNQTQNSETTEKTASPEATATAPALSMSVLSPNLRIRGAEIDSDEDFTIHGHFEGKLRCRNLIVSQGASVSGDIVAQVARISGSMAGNIKAENVLIFKGGSIGGEVKCRSMGIQPGSTIKASIDCDATEQIANDVTPPAAAVAEPQKDPSGINDGDFSLKLVHGGAS